MRALTENVAETSPGADDPSLRGRTYAVPFDRVWETALELAGSRPRWEVLSADDGEGVIRAAARTMLFRFVDDVTLRVRLDANGQTRVDMTSASRVGSADLGTNRRRVRRFMRALDRALEVTPAQILDPGSSLAPVGSHPPGGGEAGQEPVRRSPSAEGGPPGDG